MIQLLKLYLWNMYKWKPKSLTGILITIKLLKYQCCYTAVGYVFGYAEGYTTSLQCMPFPFELSSEDTAYRNADVLELTTAFIDVKGVTGVFDERLQNKPIKCAFCHVKNTKTVSQLQLYSVNFIH